MLAWCTRSDATGTKTKNKMITLAYPSLGWAFASRICADRTFTVEASQALGVFGGDASFKSFIVCDLLSSMADSTAPNYREGLFSLSLSVSKTIQCFIICVAFYDVLGIFVILEHY